ncbi:MAG: UDP-galactopyranose mutase [Bacilli bacterium]|nr:UDP-galactopyranose mutase [Bacilli bacterium]
MKYDYLVVGSGLFGATFAYEANKRGKKVLVIDKRNHIGGNIYTENIEGINVHKYGAHIFHTDNKEIWQYINSFAEFNRYTNSPVARYKNEIYNMPFNMNTFAKIWDDVITPEDALRHINEEKQEMAGKEPQNLEEQAISLVGRTIYEKLVKGYTEKQWNRDCKDLPTFIIKRLPVRLTYDNNYFNDLYQGIPIGGYTQIIEKMLNGIDVELNANYFDKKEKYNKIAHKIVYTGMLDEYFDCKLGRLEYRSLRFENQVLDIPNYQGNAVVNYTGREVDYTRVIEHKHFEYGNQEKTVITYEYPDDWNPDKEAYYTINDERNNELAKKYHDLAMKETNVIFGGRLAEYKYYDMDDVIEAALNAVHKEFETKEGA